MKAILAVALAMLAGTAFAADSYTVAPNATVTIDEQGTCRQVTNPSGASGTRWISTKTASEWQSFIDHSNGLTMAACPVPCGGASVGGYCWYMSAAGDSCDSACSSHSGCNLSGTRDYAGSGGTLANCQAVITALSQGSNVTVQSYAYAIGCSGLSGHYYFLSGTPTTCAAIESSRSGAFVRACACNN